MTAIRIIYTTQSWPYGKGEAFLTPEIEELASRGHDLLVVPVSPHGRIEHDDCAHLEGRVLHHPEGVSTEGIRAVQRTPLLALRWASRIAYGSGSVTSLLVNHRSFLKSLWLGRFAQEWGAEHIHSHWLDSSSTMGMIAGSVSGVPWSFTAHRYDISLGNLTRRKIAEAAFCRFISHSGVDSARSLGLAPPERKTHVIRMGVRLPSAHSDGALARRRDGPFTLLCAANLVPVKRHSDLVTAIALLRDRGVSIQLLLAGDGPLRQDIDQLVRRQALDSAVHLLGVVPHREVLSLLANGAVDASILASDIEGLPVFLVESLAHSVPCIGTTVGGVPELLGDGCGLLVPPREPAALADAIASLAGSTQFRARLGAAGQARAAREYDVRQVADRLTTLMSTTPCDSE